MVNQNNLNTSFISVDTVIKGDILTNDSIIVEGVVEGAEIIAGGQIIVKHGVQGMSRCRLIANGNIISRFIESAYVRSETGYVQSESIMHSKVSAKTDIIVDGKKGFISGGEVRCGQMISAKTIGSSMGTSTVLTVGIDPVLVEEHHKLEKEAADITKEQTSSTNTNSSSIDNNILVSLLPLLLNNKSNGASTETVKKEQNELFHALIKNLNNPLLEKLFELLPTLSKKNSVKKFEVESVKKNEPKIDSFVKTDEYNQYNWY